MNNKIDKFFKEAQEITNYIGGYVMVARNATIGYGCNGLYQMIKGDNGYKLVKEADGMANKQDFDFESLIFNKDTIKKIEFGSKFGPYANIYIDDSNYIHVHLCLLD